MKLYFNGMLYALSYALDSIETELVGVSTGHSKWVAYISVLMGRGYGLSDDELYDLAACAALHDNALTQYIAEEKWGNIMASKSLGKHCELGEKNVECFPFRTDVKGVILYHHENADGSGTFGVPAEETPLMAQIIHLADMLDASCKIQDISTKKYQQIKHFLTQRSGTMFARGLVEMFFEVLPEERYLELDGKKIDQLIQKEIPEEPREYSFEQVKAMMDVFGRIIDYKSPFTRNHSFRIAEKVMKMGELYGYDEYTCERLYIAGVLHDIGKMAILNDVLEKPDKLSDTEFAYMQNHAWYTYKILSQIKDFDDITDWAAHHHEKLNGKGYPFGLTAEQLSEKERMMCCIDIYQALSEDRPYKPGMTHERCMQIMRDMVGRGFIDGKITEDIDKAFGVEK